MTARPGPKQPKDDIGATMVWDVARSGGGLSGLIRLSHTDSVRLDVIELHTVIR